MGCCDSSTQFSCDGGIFGAGAGVAEGDAAARGSSSVALRAGDAGNSIGAQNVIVIDDYRKMTFPITAKRSAGTWLLLLLLRFYQTFFSPFLGGACKFYPSCSRYAQEAIAVHGARRGAWLAMKRLGRCRPFTKGGLDPVPDVMPWQKSPAELGGSESDRTRGASAAKAASSSEAYVVAKATTPKPTTHKATTDELATEKATAHRTARACRMPDYGDAEWLRSAGKERAQ
jgi:uncharacterized protein